MKLLIEDFPYPAEKVRGLLGGEEWCEKDGICRIGRVGYFYNPLIKDCVFILPKVILNYNEKDEEEKEKVFGEFSPTEIIDFSSSKFNNKQKDFIYKFSIWIYRSIVEFSRLNEKLPKEQQSRIIYRKRFSNVSLSGQNIDGTLLDIILSLIQFAKKNRDFVLFIIKNIHRGYNKIHWGKTMAKKKPIIVGGTPHFYDVVNKKKQINFEEELLIIFFSILQYVRDKYGFQVQLPYGFDLIVGSEFDRYLSGLGKIRLMQIKCKYFSDKALKLWNLCYCFFEMIEKMFVNTGESEYLYVSNYNVVFETMVDEIISDKDIPTQLKNQRDGKRVDHIYRFNSLISPEEKIYYIGDSKYYKVGASVQGNSEYKQYTYARNVIQYNIELALENRAEMRYIDKLTEGYNVTPNFFISAEIEESLDYTKDSIESSRSKPYKLSRHFTNRLFDRDTLWLSHYNINFLYVLALFVSPQRSIRDELRDKLRNKFREQIITILDQNYDFFSFEGPEDIIKSFVHIYFKKFAGQMFHFESTSKSGFGTLIVAIEKNDKNNVKLCLNKFSQTKLCDLANAKS